MDNVIQFRPRQKAEAPKLPEIIKTQLQSCIESFAWHYAAHLEQTTVDNAKFMAVLGLLDAYKKSADCPGMVTQPCGRFNCTFDKTASPPMFYLDYVTISSHSRRVGDTVS